MITKNLAVAHYFKDLRDPRKHKWKCRHCFYEIIAVTIIAVICGMTGWEEIVTYAKAKKKFLKKKLKIKFQNGVPSADTFRRVISSIKPAELQKAFVDWIQALCQHTNGAVISIDGKTARRSYDKAKDKKALHMIAAWAHANGVSLGQVATDSKSNEITAIPRLLEMLIIKNCIVVIDAEGCQKKIAEQIREQEGDYLLALKGNHPKLFKTVKDHFDKSTDVISNFEGRAEKGHGRIEKRSCRVISAKELGLPEVELNQWKDIKSFIMVEAKVIHLSTNHESIEKRFYLSSLESTAERFLECIRGHWGIETALHWVLDVVMREDDSRIRDDDGAENFSVLRRIAINYLRQESSDKGSLKSKQVKAALDDEYLEKILKLC